MHGNVVVANSEKSLVDSGVNEKSEWIKEILLNIQNMMNMGNMMNCLLRVQIKFEFTKGLK